MLTDEHQKKDTLFPLLATPDSVATAVFTAALMAKGNVRPVSATRELSDCLVREVHNLGLSPVMEPPSPDRYGAFTVWGLVLVHVMADGQNKADSLERLKAGLRERMLPLGLLVDFNSSLVLDGITRVNLKAVVDAVDVEKQNRRVAR
ncbi:MAG: hypothetical protein V2A34_12885 [Lentisphaerota bacterium]